ncbi:unnamed protein product [Urochloa decumbens]|uniref:Uncharacterized protein n=1 Tax=Urochloa decumbens TaxID=240449 RepID=A0ABC9F5Q4_9POAL
MAGRLRHRGDGCLWEVKLTDTGVVFRKKTDTGVRLIQASVEATMAAFLRAGGADRGEDGGRAGAVDRRGRARARHLRTVLHAGTVTLTRFKDGGYAIGASCSLLLADPLSLACFLKSWARKHAELQAQNKLAANPVIQYTRYLHSVATAAAKRVKSVPLDTATAAGIGGNTTTTVLFRAAGGAPDHRALAAACVADASARLGARAPGRVTVMARDGSGGLSVLTTCTAADGGDRKACHGRHGHAPRAAQWCDEAGLEDLALEGRKPVHVSYAVSPCADEGLVVVMPAGTGGGGELLITATVPNYM